MKVFVNIILILLLASCVKTMDRINPLDGKTKPFLTTNAITSFTSTTAVATGVINNDGGLSISSRGVYWSKAPNSSPELMNKVESTTSSYNFTTNMVNLSPATTIYVRAFATNLAGTSYGAEVKFTTKNDTPYISTTSISAVTQTSFNTGGVVTMENGSAVTSRGLVYGLSALPTPTTGTVIADTGKGLGAFVSVIKGYKPVTTYYIRAYAANALGKSYGNQIIYTTGAITPTMNTLAASGITSSSVNTGGVYVTDGGNAIIDKGVVWSTSENPTTTLTTRKSVGGGNSSFNTTITGLISGTTYFIKSYATNAAGTSYGQQEVFTTSPAAPIVSTGTIKNILATTVDIDGVIVDNGGADITDYGFVYSTNAGPSIYSGTVVSVGNTTLGKRTMGFINTMKNLKPGTTFYIRAYAKNSFTTGYGSDVIFTTLPSVASLVSNGVVSSDVTESNARVTGWITDNGGSTITSSGVVWSLNPAPTMLSNVTYTSGAVSQTSVAVTLTGLIPATTYYAKVFAKNSNGFTLSSNEIYFTTVDNSPKFTTTTATVLADNSVAVSAKVTTQGNKPIIEKGFIYTSNVASTLTYQNREGIIPAGTGLGDINKTIPILLPGKNYLVRAYGTNDGIYYGYGATASFKTNVIPPTVTTNAYEPSSIGITANGTTITDGGDNIAAMGFVWSTSSTPTIETSSVYKSSIGGVGNFSYTIPYAGLTRGVRYYFRAYAKNGLYTVYGATLNFITP